MKKILFVLALAATLAGCSKEETIPAIDKYTLTGYTMQDTKTGFGTPGTTSIPFEWSEGDKIWSGSAKSDAAEINPDGSASFAFSAEPESKVYYNMTGTSATEASIPSEQSVSQNLGLNGDFGYATVSNGTFTLEHATAYLWFDVSTAVSNAELQWIEIDTGGTDIAGTAEFNGTSFGNITSGSSIVKLTVNQNLSSTNSNVWAMVAFPANLEGKTVRITYKLTVGQADKYYIQELSGANIQAGKTKKIQAVIEESKLTDYYLKVLTFEDKPGSTYWSDLIPAEDEQAYGASPLIYNLTEPYTWQDEYTRLKHEFPYNWDTYAFSGGGYVISKYTGSLEDLTNAQDIYDYQLSIPFAGGHNSSSNFVIGYHDSNIDAADDVKPTIIFYDEVPRVIDHMYITNASVTMYCITYGNQFSDAYDGDDYLDVVATGYNGNVKGSTIKFRLAEGANTKIDKWVKWDLSQLGAVTKVVFHMEEYQFDDYGGVRYTRTPMYFAYDDVAVRFEE